MIYIGIYLLLGLVFTHFLFKQKDFIEEFDQMIIELQESNPLAPTRNIYYTVTKVALPILWLPLGICAVIKAIYHGESE